MRYFTVIVTCIFLLAGLNKLSARTSLYLHPRVPARAELSVGDIGTIEGETDAVDVIAGIPLGGAADDGYVDAGEIINLIRDAGMRCDVYGTAVRLYKAEETVAIDSPSGMEGITPAVKKGNPVTVIARRGAIRIQVAGTALGDAMTGENVPVRTGKRGIIHCRVVDGRTVEVEL